MTGYEDRFWSSRDGLRLHYRDYAPAAGAPAGRPPVVCIPGLTRNARDFANLAEHIAAQGWRVLCVDLRGRGDSAYAKDSASYVPPQYVDDLQALLEEAGIDRFVAIGTSLGGLITMILAMVAPERIAAAVLNDIGPEVEPEGLSRIRDYVGKGGSFATWMHAARALEETQGHAHPGNDLADWLAAAKRVMTVGENGRIVFDYDMKIAEPFAAPAGVTGFDLWPGVAALGGKPLLVVRGGLSDLFAAPTHARMGAEVAGAELLTLPDVGHAPTLDEPQAVAAIDRLLARVS